MCFCYFRPDRYTNVYLLSMALFMHVGKPNKNALKVLIAAEYVGVEVKCPDHFELGVSNKTPEFLKMNPVGKVCSCFGDSRWGYIRDCTPRLNTDTRLFGSSRIEYGQIEQWIDFASMEIDLNLLTWLRLRLGLDDYVASIEETSIAALKRALDALNTYLAAHTFLVGDDVTLADIIMTCNLYAGFRFMMTKTFTSEFPHVERYFWTMIDQPNFRKIIGELKQAEVVPPIPNKINSYTKPKDEPIIVETKEDSSKPEEEKPKPKNTLDLLPPSKMILDDWKRLYSNTKTNFREVAIKGFWEMFDLEGYSLWFCNYKYNDENTVSFVTMNKVGGFLQRMDLARKYAFGKMLIIGNEPPFKVKGLWLFRGPDIPKFVMDECYDMELYEWRKVDPSDEVQKERVNQMFEDHEPFEGETLLDAKCFK
uniref:Putative translation elongation factor EF1B, gamma chain, conserved, S-crystallin n=1 Tax=Helianthus annuus TaxID=4232 RepID=A0A251V633_HELAN